jgi:hypothetical protein
MSTDLADTERPQSSVDGYFELEQAMLKPAM